MKVKDKHLNNIYLIVIHFYKCFTFLLKSFSTNLGVKDLIKRRKLFIYVSNVAMGSVLSVLLISFMSTVSFAHFITSA